MIAAAHRRKLLRAFVAAALGAPLFVRAQAGSGKLRKIGFLGSESATGWAKHIEAFRAGLRDHGYIEGKTIVVEYRWADGAHDRLPQLAAELVREKVEIIVTHGSGSTRAAQRATKTVPIVIASYGGDPVQAGFAKALGRPGGNITGLLSLSTLLSVKLLELVREFLPQAQTVLLLNSAAEASPEGVAQREAVARKLKLDARSVLIETVEQLDAALAKTPAQNVDALLVNNHPFLIAHFDRIATFAARHRLPALGNALFADRGGLFGYGANVLTNYRRVGYYVDRIFKGASPAELPIEQPMTFELVVNLKTAAAIGVKIPEGVLARADRVIR